MKLKIEPLRVDEIDAYTEVHRSAFFNSDEVTAPLLVFKNVPGGMSHPLIQAQRHRRFTDMIEHDPDSWCYTAKDAETGKIVGISWWREVNTPFKDKAEADAAFAKASESRAGRQQIEGINTVVDEAFWHCLFYEAFDVIPGVPHVDLALFAVHNDYQGRGIGSTLLRHGLQKVDEVGFPSFVIATARGKALYERFGYDHLRDFPFDARDYGAEHKLAHWTLLRPAKTSGTSIKKVESVPVLPTEP